MGNTDGTTYPVGLILCESGGTDTSFTTLSTITRPTDAALTAHSMILTVTPDGFGGADWSYSFDGGTVTNGNIASFDFTTENFVFYAHARDDEVIRAIQDVTLTAFAPWGLEVYRDTYNDGDRVTNPDVGGGLSNSGVSGGNWNENNPDYITGVGNVPNRANAYTVGYNLSLGFKLDVDYSWTVDTGGNNQFAFGVFADFVANAHYENGFVNATKNLSGIGFNLMPGADVDDEGLILAEKDGGGVGTTGFTLLDADVTASGAHNLTLTVVPDGSGGADWSYTYDRGVVANGNIASFDFSPDNGFSFIVYGRDNDGEKQVHKVRLIARRCLGSTFRF